MEKYSFYKENPKNKVFWVDNPDVVGEFLFSFDKRKIYKMIIRNKVYSRITDERKRV